MRSLVFSAFFAIFLPAAPVHAKVFFDTLEGCKVELPPPPFPEPLEISWTGACVKGKIHGIGVLYWKDRNTKGFVPALLEYFNGESRFPEYSINENGNIFIQATETTVRLEQVSSADCTKSPACNRIYSEFAKSGGRLAPQPVEKQKQMQAQADTNYSKYLNDSAITQGTDGVIFEWENSKDPFERRAVIGYGGPCKSAGVQRLVFHSPGVLIKDGRLRTEYSFMYYVQMSVGEAYKNVWKNTKWNQNISELKQQLERQRRERNFKVAGDTNIDLMAQTCMSTSYMQYVLALENWYLKNTK